MRNYLTVIESDPQTGLFVGCVPDFPGAHSQGASLDEPNANLRKVLEMLLKDGEPEFDSEFMSV